MRWPSANKPSSAELLRTPHRLQAEAGKRRWPSLLPLLLVVVIAGLLGLRHHDQAERVKQREDMAAQNQALLAALDESRLQQREAQAAQEQLMRRLENLSLEAKQLKTELAFFRQQKDGK